MKKLFNISAKLQNERGVTLVYVALLLVVFLGMAALAIDVGYNRVVRNQLQNAADAAAIAGCNMLYARAPVTFPAPLPNWAAASAEAANAITINTADNIPLSVGAIATGWWDITQPPPGSLWSGSPPTSPPPNTPPTSNYGPAVSVTIVKTGSQNSGPIVNFFGAILGKPTTDAGATATAVAASPGSVRPGAVIPVAISKTVADLYGGTNTPITIGSPYMYPNTLAGQWTSFLLDDNSATSVRGLISGGNPTTLSIGQDIWIVPGVTNTLYANPNQPSIDNTYAGMDIIFPIVDATLIDSTHSEQPIVGFIGFHIDHAYGGSIKTIVGHFATMPSYGGGPIGPYYGPLDLCRLCQ
jgi:hypothetical protein